MRTGHAQVRHDRGYHLQRWVCGTVDRPNRRSDMALPTLTPEQRADALAKAQAARKKRSELLASVKAAAVMEEAGIDDNRRVGGLGEQQRKKLLEAVSG